MKAVKTKTNTSDTAHPVLGGTPNPPRGERSDFVKVTVTLPPELYKLLMDEAARRKMTKEPNPVLSAIIREAVQEYLGKSTVLTRGSHD